MHVLTCPLKVHSDLISWICAGRLFLNVGAEVENNLVGWS